MRNTILILLISCIVTAPALAEIKRFTQVSPGIFRGSQPETEQDFDVLANLPIRTVISLRTDPKSTRMEMEELEERGIGFVHIPFSPIGSPSDEKVRRALQTLTDPDLQPVFIHCQLGKDRTGLIIGLYRVLFENWERERAYEEMRKIGFNPILAGLTAYFWIESKTLEPLGNLATDLAMH